MKVTNALRKVVVIARASLNPILHISDSSSPYDWIDRETWREMNVIINNHHGFDIFTDGHWKLTGSGIEDVMQSKRP